MSCQHGHFPKKIYEMTIDNPSNHIAKKLRPDEAGIFSSSLFPSHPVVQNNLHKRHHKETDTPCCRQIIPTSKAATIYFHNTHRICSNVEKFFNRHSLTDVILTKVGSHHY